MSAFCLLLSRSLRIFAALLMKEAATIDYQQKYQELQVQHEALKAELNQLKRLIFASRQERFLPADNVSAAQLSLDITAAPIPAMAVSSAAKKVEYTKT